MWEYLSRVPIPYTISPNLKWPVTHRNIKNVGFTNSQATHVNYSTLDRLATVSNKYTKNA
jgi:hypothetical protein